MGRQTGDPGHCSPWAHTGPYLLAWSQSFRCLAGPFSSSPHHFCSENLKKGDLAVPKGKELSNGNLTQKALSQGANVSPGLDPPFWS